MSWFPASMTLAKNCGGPSSSCFASRRRGNEKKKENVGVFLAGELELHGMLGKPQLRLPSSSTRCDALAGWQKGLLSSLPSDTEHKVKPSFTVEEGFVPRSSSPQAGGSSR